MPRLERPEPILPVHNLDVVRAFYQKLGFRAWFEDLAGYEIVSRGNLVVHLEEHPDLVPTHNQCSCYWRVVDADVLHAVFSTLKLPEEGIPRLTPPQNESWGMREFTITDPSGNLIRVGHDLDSDAANAP